MPRLQLPPPHHTPAKPITITSLPNEVLYHTLRHLPLTSLLTFRCVCHHWRTLVSTANHAHIPPLRHQLLQIWDSCVRLSPSPPHLTPPPETALASKQTRLLRGGLLDLLETSELVWPEDFITWAAEWPCGGRGWLGVPLELCSHVWAGEGKVLLYRLRDGERFELGHLKHVKPGGDAVHRVHLSYGVAVREKKSRFSTPWSAGNVCDAGAGASAVVDRSRMRPVLRSVVSSVHMDWMSFLRQEVACLKLWMDEEGLLGNGLNKLHVSDQQQQ